MTSNISVEVCRGHNVPYNVPNIPNVPVDLANIPSITYLL